MISSILLLCYYLLATFGVLMAGVRMLRRIPLFAQTENWLLFLAAGAIWPALLAWSGWAGLHRLPMVTILIGAASAFYGGAMLVRNQRQICDYARQWRALRGNTVMLLAVLLGLIVHIVVQHCYFEGGIHNFDQTRGLSFTSAFAANYLKPAHPLDLSVPISYGYYVYEHTAFLYAAVGGYSWPSITLVAASLLCVLAFYVSFVHFTRAMIPGASSGIVFFACLAVTFFGLDIFENPGLAEMNQHIEWWNAFFQIATMASLWNWLYHYLASLAFSLSAYTTFIMAIHAKRRDLLALSAIFTIAAPLFVPITGAFLSVAFVIASLLYLLRFYKQDETRWLLKQIPLLFLPLLALSMLLILPQLFTFIGRASYLSFRTEPVLWFSRIPLASATAQDWWNFARTLFMEIGPLLSLGALLLPFYAARNWQRAPFAVLGIVVLAVFTFASVMMVDATTHDWHRRSGGIGIVLCSAIPAAWLLHTLRTRPWLYAAGWLVGITLLAPGVWNFYKEETFRYRACAPAPAFLTAINRETSLHTPTAYTTFDPLLIYQAGRISIAPGNPAWEMLGVYNLPADFLKRWFNWSGDTATCHHSWYGKSLPDNVYYTFTAHQPVLELTFAACPIVTP